MRRLGLLVPFALALGLSAAVPREEPLDRAIRTPPRSAQSQQAAAPFIALLLTPPQGDTTELVFQQPGANVAAPVAAILRHVTGGTVKGAVLPNGRTVVAIADVEPGRDPSWGAALYRLEEGREPVRLADRVYTSTRPLVLDDGRVVVQRGRAGSEPSPESDTLRVDEITVDVVDPLTGNVRTLHTYAGYIAFLAGALDREAFVYRVGPHGADIVAIDVNTGALRVLVPTLLPFARDFSVDRKNRALVFTQRDERSTRLWAVERLDLVTSARTRLATAPRMALVPHALPDGRIALNPEGERGLSFLLPNGRIQSLRPLGDGVDVLRDISPDGKWAALLHTLPSQLPKAFVLSLDTYETLPLHVKEGVRVEIAGVVP